MNFKNKGSRELEFEAPCTVLDEFTSDFPQEPRTAVVRLLSYTEHRAAACGCFVVATIWLR